MQPIANAYNLFATTIHYQYYIRILVVFAVKYLHNPISIQK